MQIEFNIFVILKFLTLLILIGVVIALIIQQFKKKQN